MTLAKIIDTFKMLALKHPNINSAYEGNIYDILNANPSNKYASVVLTQQSHTTDATFDHYGFVIFYVDRLVDDMEENRVQIQSIGKSMLSNIITAFCNNFEAECNNITFQPFTQRFVDETAGVYCTITIDIVKDMFCEEKLWDENWIAPTVSIRNQSKTVEFTENGTYIVDYDAANFTGLEKVVVEVNLDTESIRNEGYESGYGDGYAEGEQVSYTSGYEDGYVAANEEVVETARVLEITENGEYYSEFSKEGEDFIFDEPITGDGDFLDYISLDGIGYNTNIIPTEYTRIECWVKPSETPESDACIFGTQWMGADGIFKIRWVEGYDFEWNGIHMSFDMEANVWHHIIASKQDGLILDGEVLYEPWDKKWNTSQAPIWINRNSNGDEGVNGDFGMFKIDDTVFIPYEGGYLNTTTNEPLVSYSFGNGYKGYHKVERPTLEGSLIRTVKVNIIPKINVAKEGVRLSYSNFEELPDCFDFTGITSLERMFSDCPKLKIAPNTIPTSEVTNISFTFNNCGQLIEVPSYDFSNAINMSNAFAGCSKLTDLSFMEGMVYPKNADMSSMFSNISNLAKCPALYIEGNNTYYQSYPFWGYSNLNSFTDFGGFVGLKYSMDKDYELPKCPNLSYESCINVLNGLYDFVGNGETPTSSQGKLKVAQSFIDKLSEEDLQIPIKKGWLLLV